MKRLAAIAFLMLFAGCAKPANQDVIKALADQLAVQYHQCVPLGWAPVSVAGTYYPGYTATLASYEMWFDAIWRGRIDKDDLRNPQAQQVRTVLDRFVAAGLLKVEAAPHGYDYFMRRAAVPYFYGSDYGNNRDSLPYLCFSAIVPQNIVAMKRIPAPYSHAEPAQWYDLTFTWRVSAPAAWAADPVLASHSVVLPPVSSPTTARIFKLEQTWYVSRIANRDWMMPRLIDAAAWR